MMNLPRRSIPIAEAADIMGTSIETIARLVEAGEIQGHYLRRERRIYVDSIAAYQDGHPILPKVRNNDKPPARKPRNVMTDADRILKGYGL